MNPFREAMRSVPGHLHKNDYTDGRGNYCINGHIAKVMGITDEEMYDTESMIGHFRQNEVVDNIINKVAVEQFPDRTCDFVVAFNDHPDTTEDEVLMILDKAAVQYDEGLDTF